MACRQVVLLVFLLGVLLAVSARPDGGDSPPVPGPGLSYGGIPYGSVSGAVADYSKRFAPSSGRSLNYNGDGVNYAPIEQWL